MIHRVAKVQLGRTALVRGAAGGVGTAALQLLRLAGVKTYGAASAPKHKLLRSLGVIPIDYRVGAIDRLTRTMEPAGVDYAFDAVGGANTSRCIGALRRGGTLVGFGFMGASTKLSQLAMFANIFVGARSRGHVLRRHQAVQEGPTAAARGPSQDFRTSWGKEDQSP
jgi:NADPH:quinone reductase